MKNLRSAEIQAIAMPAGSHWLSPRERPEQNSSLKAWGETLAHFFAKGVRPAAPVILTADERLDLVRERLEILGYVDGGLIGEHYTLPVFKKPKTMLERLDEARKRGITDIHQIMKDETVEDTVNPTDEIFVLPPNKHQALSDKTSKTPINNMLYAPDMVRVFYRVDEQDPASALKRYLYLSSPMIGNEESIVVAQARLSSERPWEYCTPQFVDRFIRYSPNLPFHNGSESLIENLDAWSEINHISGIQNLEGPMVTPIGPVRACLHAFRDMGLKVSERLNEWPRSYYRDDADHTDLYTIRRDPAGELVMACDIMFRDPNRGGALTELNMYTVPLADFANPEIRDTHERTKARKLKKLPMCDLEDWGAAFRLMNTAGAIAIQEMETAERQALVMLNTKQHLMVSQALYILHKMNMTQDHSQKSFAPVRFLNTAHYTEIYSIRMNEEKQPEVACDILHRDNVDRSLAVKNIYTLSLQDFVNNKTRSALESQKPDMIARLPIMPLENQWEIGRLMDIAMSDTAHVRGWKTPVVMPLMFQPVMDVADNIAVYAKDKGIALKTLYVEPMLHKTANAVVDGIGAVWNAYDDTVDLAKNWKHHSQAAWDKMIDTVKTVPSGMNAVSARVTAWTRGQPLARQFTLASEGENLSAATPVAAPILPVCPVDRLLDGEFSRHWDEVAAPDAPAQKPTSFSDLRRYRNQYPNTPLGL